MSTPSARMERQAPAEFIVKRAGFAPHPCSVALRACPPQEKACLSTDHVPWSSPRICPSPRAAERAARVRARPAQDRRVRDIDIEQGLRKTAEIVDRPRSRHRRHRRTFSENQCAEIARITLGLGTAAPSRRQASVYWLRASVFIGLPWPKKMTGIRASPVLLIRAPRLALARVDAACR